MSATVFVRAFQEVLVARPDHLPDPITTKMKNPSITGPTGSLSFFPAPPRTMPVPRLCTFSWNLPLFAFATRLLVVCKRKGDRSAGRG